MSVTSWRKLSAFCAVTTGLPVSASSAFLVTPRDITAAPGDLLIFVKALRLLRFRNIGGRRFCRHGQHQLQIAHIIAEIFLFQPLEIFILPRVHARPRAGDLVRENGVFFAFLHAALFHSSVSSFRMRIASSR